MRRVVLALILGLGLAMTGHAQQAQPGPARFACIYAVSMDVDVGVIVVLWGDPPCSMESFQAAKKEWVAPIKWHCKRHTVYSGQTLATPPEPVVMGSACGPESQP